MPVKYLACEGSVVDGFQFYGPFDNEEDAIEYADLHCQDAWVVAPLYPQENN